MSVGTYALTSLDNARDYLGTSPRKSGIWLYCCATDATAATAQVSDTTLTLIVTGGASAATKTFTFGTLSISALVTAINAYANPAGVYPWVSGAICNDSADSTDLVMTGPQSCLGSANELTLQIEDNYLVCNLVDRATDSIERYCNRKLMNRAYHRQMYMGSGNEKLVLEQYPVTRVFRISHSELNVFSIKQVTATTFATFTVTPTLVRLDTDGTVTDITIGSYSLISDVVAAINAVTGWQCNILNADWAGHKAWYYGIDGTTKVSELFPVAAAYCKSPILAWGRIPSLYDMTEFWLDKRGVDEERDPGILYAPGGFVQGQYYWIDYQAGYTTTPAALEEACLLLVKYKYDSLSHDNSIKDEALGDYRYSLRDIKGALPDDVMRELNGFRRFAF